MFVMHFYLVCNMNKIVRVLVVYILILAITGAAEIKSKNISSLTTTTTKWKKPETTPRWKEATLPAVTTTTKLKEPSTTTRWRERTTTTKLKEPSTTTKWREPTTTKWKYSTTSTTTTKQTTNQPPTAKSWKQPITTKATSRNFQTPDNGVVAVASFSGVDSRNGRLSPMSGIKIYPPADSSMVKSDNKGTFIFKSVNGKMPMPITITKEGDGVSGTIRILPGSVSVSSSASSTSKSGPASAVAASYNPWPTPYMKPIMNDIYFPPFPQFPTFPSMPDPIFDAFPDSAYHKKMPDPFPYMRIQEPTFPSHMQDPWYNRDMFKQPQIKHDMYQPNWLYPSFNPFINYWR